jgi:tripartite-type tricarboxylate transporter receptor subunit TctC
MQAGRKLTWIVIVLVSFLLVAPQGWAKYPNKPITLIVTFSAGGSTDQVSRAIAAAAEKVMGNPVVVVNKPGGAGSIGAAIASKAKPNGYTLLVTSPAAVMAQHTKKVPYDILTDFRPIMRFTGYVFGMACLSSKPWQSIKDLVEDAKKRPGEITYGTSGGMGTNPHLAMEEFCMKAGIKLKHVPYKGGAPNLAAMLGGHVDLMSGPMIFLPHVDAGKARFLVTYTENRIAAYPDTPTFTQSGYEIVYPAPIGIAGPTGISDEVVDVISKTFQKAMEDPNVKKVHAKFHMPLIYEGPEKYGKTLKWIFEDRGKLIRQLGLQVKK